jgi:O-antigen/teichoic acid export membrane protein
MVSPLSDSLKKIARGTGVALAGTVLALLLGFVSRIIIARYGSEADYGVYSLAIVIMTFVITLVMLGLPDGSARYIAYFRGRGKEDKVRGVTSVSLQLAAVSGVVFGAALFFSADYLAINIFHTPDLAHALKIIAIGIPFFALINILASVFRGFDRMEPQAYFQYALFNVLFLLLVAALAVLHLPFVDIFYFYVGALILTFTGLLIYTSRKLPQPMAVTGWRSNTGVRKELLVFSLPLLATGVLAALTLTADTFLLGYFKTPEIVGLYNAARPMAQFISEPLALMMLIYAPVATGLYAKNLMDELKRSYIISTKWVVSITFPFFLVLCLFPEAVLNLLFGPAYVAAAPALRILSIGFIVGNLLGPRVATLVALGKIAFVFWVSLGLTAAYLLLNIVLIPPLGINGAAIALASSLTLGGIITAVKVYTLCRMQPLSSNLLKPIIASIVLAVIFKFATYGIAAITWWMLILFFILYYAIYGVAVLFTRSFDREDIALLLEIEKMSGINATPIKKVLRRFV